MLTRILSLLRTARFSDWLAALIFTAAFVGCVEAPWIAPHFVSQENNNG